MNPADKLDIARERGRLKLGIGFLEILIDQPVQLRGGQGRRSDRTCRPLGQGSSRSVGLVNTSALLHRGFQLLQRFHDFNRRLLIKQRLSLSLPRRLGLLGFLGLESQTHY